MRTKIPAERAIFGVVRPVSPNKRDNSLFNNVCSERDYLVLNNGMAQLRNCSVPGWSLSHYIVHHEESALCDAAFRQNPVTTCSLNVKDRHKDRPSLSSQYDLLICKALLLLVLIERSHMRRRKRRQSIGTTT